MGHLSVASDNSSVRNMSEDVMYGVEDSLGMSVQSMVEVVVYHSVLFQNVEHLADGSLVVDSGVVDDSVESVYKVHVSNLSVHLTLIEG